MSDLRHLTVVFVSREAPNDSRSGRKLHDLGKQIGSCLELDLCQSKGIVISQKLREEVV